MTPASPSLPPVERLAILELRAARGWSLAQTARRLLVTPGGQALHSGILDPKLFVEESDLVSKAVVFGLKPHPSVEVILRVATGDGEDDVRHRDGVTERDVARPSEDRLLVVPRMGGLRSISK